jgi:hypothetical protein
MTFFVVLTSFIFLNLAYRLYNIEKEKIEKLKQIEIQFLIGSMYFIEYKFHVLQILEIVYDKASETDPKFKEDYKLIKQKIEEKFEQFGNEWISNLKKTLGYETKYENWADATKYIDGIVKRLHKENKL